MPHRTKRLFKWIAVTILSASVLSASAVLLLRVWHPVTSAFMLRALLESPGAHAAPQRIRYEWVDYALISPQAALAVMASEDQQFPFHHGFDMKSIREAERNNEEGGRLRGASTITQQLAKNLFLWPGRSYVRKGLELPLALWIDLVIPKRRQLEIYLNVAEWGPNGEFGAEAGARRAFGKPASAVSPQQAALLAAMLPDPVRRNPRAPGPGL